MKKSDFSVGNPLPLTSMKTRCDRAAHVLGDYLSLAQEQALISEEVIKNCKGLAFISMIKGAYLWSGRIGSGIVVGKLPNGEWSAPSALCCFGVGYGAQVGLEFTDFVIVLRDENSLSAFTQMGNFTVGANLCLAFGPWGRNAELDVAVTFGLGYSLSKSRGIFAGISLEGMLLLENRKTNEECYGRGASARKVVAGEVPANQEVAGLMQALEMRFGMIGQKEKEARGQDQHGEVGYQRWSAQEEAAPRYSFSSPSSSPNPSAAVGSSSSSSASQGVPQCEPAPLSAPSEKNLPLVDETAGLLGNSKK